MSDAGGGSGRGKLNLLDASLLVMGGIVGVGIFFTPAGVARGAGGPGEYLALWVLGGVMALAGAMTFAELAATFPKAGGWFVFLREAFGPFPSFLFAFVALFVVSTGALATIADFCAGILVGFAPALDGGPEVAGRSAGQVGVGIAISVALTAVALAGAKAGALFQNVCMILKVAAILVIAGAALIAIGGVDTAVVPVAGEAVAGERRGFLRGMLSVLFTYGGWQLLTYVAPEVRDPDKTLPRAILIGVGGVTLLYLVFNGSVLALLGLDGIAAEGSFVERAAERSLPVAGALVVKLAMALSALGICAAITLATPWLYVAMAREGLFFRVFGETSARTGAPVYGLAAQLACVVGYLFYSGAGALTETVVFAEWIFHALVGLALLRIRMVRPELPRPFKSFAYPLFPVIYVVLASTVVVDALVSSPWSVTGVGLAVVAVGAAVYRPWRMLLAR